MCKISKFNFIITISTSDTMRRHTISSDLVLNPLKETFPFLPFIKSETTVSSF